MLSTSAYNSVERTNGANSCPVPHGSLNLGHGCAFAGFDLNRRPGIYRTQTDPRTVEKILEDERKTIVDLLIPEAPSKEKTKFLKNTDDLNPTNDEVLAMALGSPARRVLTRAELVGPKNGWRDGHLSSYFGFCPPDPGLSPTALAMSPGTTNPVRFEKSNWIRTSMVRLM